MDPESASNQVVTQQGDDRIAPEGGEALWRQRTKINQVRLDYFKDLYDRELEKRNQFLSKLSTTLATYSVVGAIFAHNATSFPQQWDNFWQYIAIVVGSGGLLAAALGLYRLLRLIFHGTDYLELPRATDIDNATQALNDAFDGTEKGDELYAEAFRTALANQYREIADFNRDANANREKANNTIFRCAVTSIGLLLICTVIHFMISFGINPPPTEIKIINPIQIMPDPKKTTATPTQAQPTTSQQSPAIVFPPPVKVNETMGAKDRDRHVTVHAKKGFEKR